MAKSLIIVESPAKARTLKKYLGDQFVVKATVGHVMDLPKSRLAINIEKGYEPEYLVIRGKQKILNELKKDAEKSDKIYLATDPDREGEAIAFHVQSQIRSQEKRGKPVHRLLFNDLSHKTIKEALKSPKRLDANKYGAQQARRLLDRLVGYQISPLLWKNVRHGLSAGRVQSAAVRLVCVREQEIKDFVSEEYWTINSRLEAEAGQFDARLEKVDGRKTTIRTQEEAEAIVKGLKTCPFRIEKIERKERLRHPTAPFITSKLQQEAYRKLRFPARKTMMLAQRLYEGLELGDEGAVGLITYMRTDSPRISGEALQDVRDYIAKKYGKDALPEHPRMFKGRKGSQEAHEAIRPTSMDRSPESLKPFLDRDTLRLYQLIWNRFVASQMKPAVMDITAAWISAGKKFTLKATGNVIKYRGFMVVYIEGRDEEEEDGEKRLPPLREGEALTLLELLPKQHFTQPPARYTEATLIKELEEKGIGRPSTYASILSNVRDRKYVEVIKGSFYPTELGIRVNDMLVENFPNILNIEFTAQMEEELDRVASGKITWVQTLDDFYVTFKQEMEKAKVAMEAMRHENVPTDIPCELCGRPMVIRWGRNGDFLSCSGFPKCKNAKDFRRDKDGTIIPEDGDHGEEEPEVSSDAEPCEKCGRPMLVKEGKYGKFLACSGYPKCKNTRSMVRTRDPEPMGIQCPQCKEGEIHKKSSRRGKTFFGCNRYPKCQYALWDRPVPDACPHCGFPLLVEKKGRKGFRLECPQNGCGYSKPGEISES
ncbi:MAG: type I DNA topoisomerase [Deltaproteobacteria bacterium]|nr:type I DNA topoisomerase [Deltaproteobacteria bacterium]